MATRIISFSMAFYVLMLVFAPCVDQDIAVAGNSQTSVSKGMQPIHEDQHDCCSPFCTCSCCSVPATLMKAFLVSQDYTRPETIVFFIGSDAVSDFFSEVWQPPKA